MTEEKNYNKKDWTYTPPEPDEEAIQMDLSLIIPLESYRKIMAYTTACDTEISGFADVIYEKEKGQLIVGEVYLLEQMAGGADVHIDEEDIAKFNHEMIKSGKEQLPQLWWHSHVDMGAFFSGTDEATSRQLKNDSFNVSLVVNKRFDMKAKMFVYTETRSKIESYMFGEKLLEEDEEKKWLMVDPLNIKIQHEYQEIPKNILTEVKKKVKPHPVIEYPKISWPNPFRRDKSGSRNEREVQHELKFGDRLIKVCRLPKDPIKAEEKIDILDLKMEWDVLSREYVWKDPATGDFWVDFWGVFEKLGKAAS